MPEEARTGSGLDQALAVWSRRKWLAILVFAGPFAAAVSLVVFLPNIYQSTATVLVDRQQVPEAFVRPTVTSELETRLQTISQEILSRSRLEGLITRFGLYPGLRNLESTEALVERMRSDIQLELRGVEPDKGGQRKGQRQATVAFAISYQGSDPRTVALVTNTLASFYIEENLKARERQATGTAEFLKVQLEEMKKRLDEQEGRVSEFKKRYMGELPQQLQANLATLGQLHAQLRLNSDNQIRAGEQQQALAKQLADVASGGPAGAPDASAARLAKLKQELTELRARFSDKYPDVIRVKAEIDTLERELAEAKTDGTPETDSSPATPYVLRLKEALNHVEAEIKILKSGEERLRAAIAAYQQRVENTPRREQEFQELARDYETTKEQYHSLLKRHEEAQLAESMEQRQKGEQFRLLDPAVPSSEPAAPKRLRLIVMALMLSLGLAAGAVVLAEQLDTSFHTVDDLRGFSRVPVLVSIPRIVTETDTRRQHWRFRLMAGSAVLGLALIVGASYFVASGNEQLVSILAWRRS